VANSIESWTGRHHFLWRRLHSLTGIVPIGVFLINHLLANSTAFLGEEQFNHHIRLIHNLPWLLGIEIVFIFLPLAFHAGYGIIITLTGRFNVWRYPYMENWRYTLQRLTAWITVAFIIIHLVHFRFAHWFGVMEYKDAIDDPGFFLFTQAGFQNLWLPTWLCLVFYAIGLTAAVYHLCNGIVTFCITWGITVSDESRKRASVVTACLGIVLMTWGVASLYALQKVSPALQSPAETTRVVQQVAGPDSGT
jgi:succinate dehydrogenase / fumarate reductase cytochrome b subunit